MKKSGGNHGSAVKNAYSEHKIYAAYASGF